MTFVHGYKATYAGAAAFLLACPLLGLFPVLFELLQHLAEVHLGMYNSVAAAKALEHHPLRMGFGMGKVAALTLSGYWIARYLAFRDPARAARAEAPAVRLFAGFFAASMALATVQLFALPPTVSVQIAALVGGLIVGALFAAWSIAAPLGNPAVGLRASVAIMARRLPWTLAFSLAATLPLMVPHYVLGALALVGPKSLLWPVLIADSLLVGALTAVIVAASYYAALRAAGKAGVALLPAGAPVVRSPACA